VDHLDGDEATVKRQHQIELEPVDPASLNRLQIGLDDGLRIPGKVVAVRREGTQ